MDLSASLVYCTCKHVCSVNAAPAMEPEDWKEEVVSGKGLGVGHQPSRQAQSC